MLLQIVPDSTSPLEELTQTAAFTQVVDLIHRIANYTLFPIGDQNVTVVTLLLVALMVVAAWIVSRALQRAVGRAFNRRGITDRGTTTAAQRFLHYAVMIIGLVLAIQQVGINLSALFAAGAVFAVAIGFAMQSVAENFLSGVTLLIERHVRNGDMLEVDGREVRVLRMGLRATLVRDRDEVEMVLPNSLLVNAAVKNYTLEDSELRLRVGVGVTYGSDMRRVREVLESVGREIPWRTEEHDPVVLLTEFGDSSVNWELSVWMDEPWRSPRAASEVRERLWWAFKEAGLVIAFPQLDVHFDPPVEDALARLPRSA